MFVVIRVPSRATKNGVIFVINVGSVICIDNTRCTYHLLTNFINPSSGRVFLGCYSSHFMCGKKTVVILQ